jgi:hypothetical protein
VRVVSGRLALSFVLVLTVLLGTRLWIANVAPAPRDVTDGQHGSGGSAGAALTHRNRVRTTLNALSAPLPTPALIGARPATGGRGVRLLSSVGTPCRSSPIYAFLRVYRL